MVATDHHRHGGILEPSLLCIGQGKAQEMHRGGLAVFAGALDVALLLAGRALGADLDD